MSQAALMESMERITKQLGETISAMSKLYNLELRDRDNEIAMLRKRVEILEMDRADARAVSAESRNCTIPTTPVKPLPKRLNPKFCVNSQRGENRSEFNVCGSGFIRLPPCVQYNAGGDGCQGRRQGRRSSERRAAAHRPLTSGPGGVIRACVRQNRWTAARGSRSSPAAVPSTFS